MRHIEFPFLLSPSPGFPVIVSLSEGRRSIAVIVAAKDVLQGRWSLIPSSSNQYEGISRIPLIQEDVQEISQSPELPSSVEGIRDILSKELLTEVLGGGIRIFKISLSLSESGPSKALRKVDDSFRPTLYDLCMEEPVLQRKPHAVCLMESSDKDLHFIHLTDLHLARRNDLIGEEISTVLGPVDTFNNFNDRMREFIKIANGRADNGNLDLILIGGDLVDFVNHGVSDEGSGEDNNWQVFIEIMIGGGHEPEKGNHGIRVPIFTTTGNHDWRFHPYDITIVSVPFGINHLQANQFDFEYYDTLQRLEAKKRNVYEKIVKEGSPISKENWPHALIKWVLGYSETWQAKTLVPIVSTLLSYLVPGIRGFVMWHVVVLFLAALLHYGINNLLSGLVRRMITHAIIPIEAGIQALHSYLLHINPYLNYAFSYGPSYFILMDTGPDCFIGQYLWDGGNKKMVRMSIKDNILGGSPDSMAFYPANEYYTYGQIVWLEQILKSIESDGKDKKRIFLCLHAPPINVENPPDIPADREEVLLEKGRIDIRHGTINHFLSQFFHLCLGKKENDPKYSGPLVDIVFSGHAHQKIEFRIDPGPLIYHGRYSDMQIDDFDYKRPFVVQTAAGGPLSSGYHNPPYFRTIHVAKDGTIFDFGQNK